MSYFRACPVCGANLDPGEQCDCIKIPPTEVAVPKAARQITQTQFNTKGDKCQC